MSAPAAIAAPASRSHDVAIRWLLLDTGVRIQLASVLHQNIENELLDIDQLEDYSMRVLYSNAVYIPPYDIAIRSEPRRAYSSCFC